VSISDREAMSKKSSTVVNHADTTIFAVSIGQGVIRGKVRREYHDPEDECPFVAYDTDSPMFGEGRTTQDAIDDLIAHLQLIRHDHAIDGQRWATDLVEMYRNVFSVWPADPGEPNQKECCY